MAGSWNLIPAMVEEFGKRRFRDERMGEKREREVPEELVVPCCSMFIVSKQAIKRWPLEFYVELREYVVENCILYPALDDRHLFLTSYQGIDDINITKLVNNDDIASESSLNGSGALRNKPTSKITSYCPDAPTPTVAPCHSFSLLGLSSLAHSRLQSQDIHLPDGYPTFSWLHSHLPQSQHNIYQSTTTAAADLA